MWTNKITNLFNIILYIIYHIKINKKKQKKYSEKLLQNLGHQNSSRIKKNMYNTERHGLQDYNSLF